jgi:RNA polymerase sigma-70 factor (ECF subfamily)
MSIMACDEPDRQDMARLAGGHDAALNELMARHAQPLTLYLVRFLGSQTEAEDLAQETFVRVYQHRDRFRPEARFATWLYTIATNLVRDRLRWRGRHPQVSLEAEMGDHGGALGDTLPAAQAAPDETLQGVERVAAIRRAVAALPEDLRLPLVLAEYEERSQAEIAAILGCSVKAVEMRLYRARQLLRKELAGWLAAEA